MIQLNILPYILLWKDSFRIYADKRVLLVLLFGFSSGLPLALTGSTLSIWLTEQGINKATIGAFALVGVPYSLKFLWSPLVDRMPLPFLTRLLGRRRGWMIFSQVLLMGALLLLGFHNPTENIYLTASLAVVVAFCSATQDIVIDAFRVDMLDEKTYGAGAATIVFGYRLGMLTSGAGALYFASYLNWSTVYALMAGLVLVGALATFVAKEPSLKEPEQNEGKSWFYTAVVAPFADFMQRPYWAVIVIFIILYKLGDVFAANMLNPFFLELEFTKIEIANISKLFGFWATLLGSFLGGILVSRYGILRSLLFCGILQLLSNLVFALQAYVGHNLEMLMVTIAVENLTSGMGTAALVAYLSSLCHASYSATQYALLSSFTAVGRTFLSSISGVIAERVTWIGYFTLTTFIALPGLLVLLWLLTKNQASAKKVTHVGL